MKRVIVSTDFSTPSDKAVEMGIMLADKLNAELLFMHAYNFPHSDPVHPAYLHGSSAIDTTELVGEARDMVEQKLEQYCEYAREKVGGQLTTDHLSVAGVYIDEAIEKLEDLEDTIVVMGTRGHGERKDTVMGSNAARTVEKSPVPVLVVPKDAAVGEMKSILYASALLEKDIGPLATVLEIAEATEAKIDLIHIDKEADEDERDVLEGFKEIVHDHYSYPHMTFHLLRGEDILERINQQAANIKADLIVMNTQQRRGLFHKSLSQEMVYLTKLPLLVFHS